MNTVLVNYFLKEKKIIPEKDNIICLTFWYYLYYVTVWLALKHAFCQAAFCQAGTHAHAELEETQAAIVSLCPNAPFHLTGQTRVTVHGPFQKIR